MATQEKLQKSLEALRNLSNLNQTNDASKRKEKMHHCHVITEAISNPTIKVGQNFQLLLSLAIETLLKLCDDQESDIRMTSEECLNRIIRAVSNGNVGKILIELHKEIKMNKSARSLRAALTRFAQLAHFIRPHKGKPYVNNLFPCIYKIVERNEEQIHETLAISLPKIIKVLGCFSSDNEIKILLKSFFANLPHQSAVIRRTAASCILSICLNSRKPYIFIVYCLNSVLDMILPVNDNQTNFLILGILNCLKTLLPHAKNQDKQEVYMGGQKDVESTTVSVDKFLRIYELCLHYLENKDHNIVNASLETLNVLLLNCTPELKETLLSEKGLSKRRIHCSHSSSLSKLKSPSQLSVATNMTLGEESLFCESELTETLHSDIEKWIDASKLSVMNVTYAKTKENFEKSLSVETNTQSTVSISDDIDYGNITKLSSYSDAIADNLDRLTISEKSSSEKSSYIDDKIEDDVLEVYIGEFLDKDLSLLYCARLIAKSFLLTGNPGCLISDKVARVSMKSLALNCLSTIVQLQPRIFGKYLDKNYLSSKISNKNISRQQISDVILFAEHCDPQLRGVVRTIVANFVKAVLVENEGDYSGWARVNIIVENTDCFHVNELVKIILKGLEDESANCIRQTLHSLHPVLNSLLGSKESKSVVPVLKILPSLAKNPYWLVKVALCELVSTLSYVTIHYVLTDNSFQNKVIHNILFELLADSDQRVRRASAIAIVEIIPCLFNDQMKETAVTTKAVELRNKFLSNLCESVSQNERNLNRKHFIETMPFPYNNIDKKGCDSVEFSLSKIVNKLYQYLLTSTSKYLILGSLETLSLLSTKYPTTIYDKAWSILRGSIKDSEKVLPDLLSLCVSLLNSSTIIYDITCHITVLTLASNIFAGQSAALLRPVVDLENNTDLWNMFVSPTYRELCENYLSHAIKLLNIYHHILNEMLPLQSQSKPVLPNLPSASNFPISPIKRRKSDLDKVIPPFKTIEKEEKNEKKSNTIGGFAHSPHYLKIYEVLRSSYSNYKVSLDSEACENFLEMLKNVLKTLSVFLEIGTLAEFGRISNELLSYLKSTFLLDPTTTVECVQQMLKALFGTNLTANVGEILSMKKNLQEDLQENKGFYFNIAQKPYNEIYACVNSINKNNKIECDSDVTLMGYLHRKDIKKVTTLSKSNDKTLTNYIRIFEPMVIKSLKQYTITCNVKSQCQVLQLLSQLVQLRVNYCLLDSEQIFIGFVLKQFEFIEEGQIPFTEELIPKIFQFLVQLSYSKQHSKSIIGVPKIIQLCDGLMASGQSPITHCIPALKPIVEDIFVTRNKSNTSDMKELETTREVLLSMLLRFAEYHEVIDLLVTILEDSKYCTDDSEKWLRWSELVVRSILPMLKQNKIKLDSVEAFASMRRFIFALNPNVFKNIDDVLVMLFQDPPLEEANLEVNCRWLSKIILLLLILTPVREDVLISKITELKGQFSPKSVFTNVVTTADPLNVTNSDEIFEGLTPELIFIRFIFRVISLSSQKCVDIAEKEENSFFAKQFSVFLMYCLHMFQSGSHCKITNLAISIINKNIQFDEKDSTQFEDINRNFCKLVAYFPTINFQWCYLLALLNYHKIEFWSVILRSDDERKSASINFEIAKIGALIVFCDYLTENLMESNHVSWILSNHIELIIKLSEESPVSEFIYSLHRNSSTSKQFIQAIEAKCVHIDDPIFKSQLLKCIENVHSSQSGAVLALLLSQLLHQQEVAVSRNISYLASRKIDLLLTMNMEEVNSQLPKHELVRLKHLLVSKNLVKKHEALVSLINKLSTQYYDLSPLEFDQRRVVNPDYIKKLDVNKKWFLSQIQGRHSESKLGKETAELLNRLEYSEIVDFMSSSDFNKLCFKDCIQLGVKNMQKEEPVIVRASIDCLLKNVARVRSSLPKPHQVYNPVERDSTSSEIIYSSQMTELFQNPDFSNLFNSILPSTSTYIKSLPTFPTLKIPDSSLEDIIKLGVISLESINYLITKHKNNLNISKLDSAIHCTEMIFKESNLCSILAIDTHISWLCSAVNSIYKLVNFLLINEEPLPSIPKYNLKTVLDNVETCAAGQACYQLYILVCWLYKIKKVNVNIPKFLLKSIESIIVSLSRMPLVNSYILIPDKVWRTGWMPELSGSFNTQVPPLPIELLQEIDILEEYIFRITLLGWTSRQQFEETWMCLLSVLCNPIENCDPVEVNDIVHGTNLAIKAITSLLLQTLYYPNPGNLIESQLIHVPRDLSIPEQTISIKKLKDIHSGMHQKYQELSDLYGNAEFKTVFQERNFEKIANHYTYGQMSIRYFLIATNIFEEYNDNCQAADVFKKRAKMLEECGLDVNSCLKFLLDYYTQIMKSEVMSHVRVLYEVVRSTVIISDLFTEKSHFVWMMETFLDLSKTHSVEDDLIHQYLIVGICKAASILMPDLEVFENIKKLLVQHIKSHFVPTRIACLYSFLYILEGCKLHNIKIGGISDEMQLMLPCVVEYVHYNINTNNNVLKNSEQHSKLVWSLAFYLIENVDEVHMETNFVANTLQTAFTVIQTKSLNSVHYSIIKGLERLVIVKKNVVEKMGKQILKLALEKMKNDNPVTSLLGCQLLITFMYTDCVDHLENVNKFAQTSPDHLVQTIEKISAIFERIKKGYVFEVEILSSILPNILDDFFSPSDILTKVIGEFLSPQQPHPKLLSKVVFQVFGSAIQRQQLSLLQDWVVFSLPNFTQSFSIGLATWCLTCFFISASTNDWLRSFFPYVQTRVGRYEYEDKKMLCIAGSNFYKNLTNEKQKQTFVENFQKVKDKPDMPYNDLLNSL